MKQIFSLILSAVILSIAQAQIECESGMLNGLEIGPFPVAIEYVPTEFTEDIWGLPMMDDDRLIIWVHGLSGTGETVPATEWEDISWYVASSEIYDKYVCNYELPSYGAYSLEFAANQLKNQFELDYTTADENSIVIGHSQGGLVLRTLDKLYSEEYIDDDRPFGGLVTFGTAHQGANILNNRDMIEQLVLDACHDLTIGYLTETNETSLLLDALDGILKPYELLDTVCDFFVSEGIPLVFDDFFDPLTDEYTVGAPEIEELNTYVPNIPYVVFYGIEDDPLIWNTLVHLTQGHSVNLDYPVWGANNDSSLTADMLEKLFDYLTNYLIWDINSDYWDGFYDDKWDWLLAPPISLVETWFDAIEASDIAEAYYQGYRWFLEANPTWRVIIGADAYVMDDCTCVCEYEDYPYYEVNYYDNPDCGACDDIAGEDPDYCWNAVDFHYETKESDGVVLVESASTVLGMTHSVSMPGSNHFSMRNDENTELRLTSLLSGEYGYFFITEPR
jgi:hypothetical protein